MKFKLLPHFPRFFSATPNKTTLHVFLWLLLIGIVSINSVMTTQSPPIVSAAIAILNRTNMQVSHLGLANHYQQNALPQEAKRELRLAHTHSLTTNILGATRDKTLIEPSKQQEELVASKQREYWLTVVAQKPEYRDAWLQLANVSQKLNRLTDMQAYLTQAKHLDPNFFTK